VKGFDPEHVSSVASDARGKRQFAGQKKPPTRGRGQEAFLLSHIKAPAQGGKAGGSKLPKGNLSNNKTNNKVVFVFYVVFII
jgi:hypothetical protein